MSKHQIRIGIDVRPLSHEITGIGRYTYNVLINLIKHYPEVDWFLYSDRPLQDQTQFAHTNVHIRTGSNQHGSVSSLFAQFFFPIWAIKDQIDTFWSPRHHLPILLALSKRLRKVVTVHDVVWKKYPETMPKSNLILERLLFPPSIKMANSIITVSDFTKSELMKEFAFTSDKTIALPLKSFFKDTKVIRQLPRPTKDRYILFVGTLEPRKNLKNLLIAFSKIRSNHKNLKLFIVGKDGWGQLSISNLIQQLDLTQQVTVTGYVPDDTLLALYRHCEVLAMPSIYEGFGLPALEALSMRRKVVITPLNAISEIAGDNIFITEIDQDSIAESLNQALEHKPINFAYISDNWKEVAHSTFHVLSPER